MEAVGVLDHRRTKWIPFVVVVFLLFAMVPYMKVLASEIGGYISEFLIARAGVASSDLVIGRSGVDGEILDIGIGAIVSTLAASDITEATTTLNGNLSDLNGMPQAVVYFEWGYDLGYGNTTAPQTLGATGNFTAVIGGYASSHTVHFRAVSETDGILYGADQTFEYTPAEQGSDFLRNMLLIVIAGTICLAVVRFAKKPLTMLVIVVVGIVVFLIAQALMDVLF